MQTHQQRLRRVVGKKNRCEGQVAHSSPFEWSRDRAAAGNLLRRLVLVLAPLHGVELRLGIIRQRILVAKAAGPGNQRGHRAPMIGGRRVHMNDVCGIEAESLFHFEAVVGVGKGERGRSIQRARGRRHIQRLRQLVTQICVVGPERERIPGLGRSLGVDQVQRLTGIVFVLLQNPGDDLAAAIRKRNPVQLVLDDGGRFVAAATTACVDALAGVGRSSHRRSGRRSKRRRLGRRSRSHLGRSLRLRLLLWRKVLQAEEYQNKDDGEDEKSA